MASSMTIASLSLSLSCLITASTELTIGMVTSVSLEDYPATTIVQVASSVLVRFASVISGAAYIVPHIRLG